MLQKTPYWEKSSNSNNLQREYDKTREMNQLGVPHITEAVSIVSSEVGITLRFRAIPRPNFNLRQLSRKFLSDIDKHSVRMAVVSSLKEVHNAGFTLGDRNSTNVVVVPKTEDFLECDVIHIDVGSSRKLNENPKKADFQKKMDMNFLLGALDETLGSVS